MAEATETALACIREEVERVRRVGLYRAPLGGIGRL